MANSYAMSNIISTSKRSACDRCRAQKLRCPAREDISKSCDRCTRLGTRCITGYQRPLGVSIGTRRSSKPELRSKPAADSCSDGTVASEVPRPLEDTVAFEMAHSRGLDILFSPRDMEPVLAQESIGPVSSWRLGTSNTPSSGLDNFYIPGASTPLVSSDGDLELDLGYTAYPKERVFEGQSPATGQLPSVLENDQRLSRLHLDFSRLAEQCISKTEAAGGIGRRQTSPTSECQKPPALPALGQWDSRVLGDALRSLSEYLIIIQSYHSRTRSGDRGERSITDVDDLQRQSPNIKTLLGMGIRLNLLSIYIQAVSIFDKLLRSLYSYLCDVDLMQSAALNQSSQRYWDSRPRPESRGADLQPLPGLEVAGFQVQQGSLQAKIILQTMLHHFARIEQLLGLPAQWRATKSGKKPSGGIIEDKESRLLLDAVRKNMVSLHQSQACLLDNTGDPPAVSSLRETVQQLERALELECLRVASQSSFVDGASAF